MNAFETAAAPVGDVARCVADTLGIPLSDIGPEMPLLTLGLDSFTAVRLRRRLRDRTGIGLELSDFFGEASVATVAAKLSDSPPGAMDAESESPPPAPASDPRATPRPPSLRPAESVPGEQSPTSLLHRDEWAELVTRIRSRALGTSETLLAAFGLVLARRQVTGPARLRTSLIDPLASAAGMTVEVDLPGPELDRWDGFASYAAEIGRRVRGEPGPERPRDSESDVPRSVRVLFADGPDGGPAPPDFTHGVFECRVREERGALRFGWHPADTGSPDGSLQGVAAALVRLLRRLAAEDAWSDRMLGWDPGFFEPAVLAAPSAADAEVRLDEPFRAAARRTGGAAALLGPAGSHTFGDLAERAGTIAAALARSGIGPGDLVAVSCAKGPAQIAAVLGVLGSGAGYVPVDPAWPASRVSSVCATAGIERALVGADVAVDWPDGVSAFHLDRTGRLAGPAPGTESPRRPDPGEIAYVIFTSGSTGTPKGVAIEHRAARTTIDDITDRFSVNADDRMLALSALGFDLSVYDIFGVLGAGGALVLPGGGRSLDPEHWLELIGRHEVTLWNTAPALLEMMVEHAEADPEAARARLRSLRAVLLSGDWIPVTLPDRLRALAVNAEVISLGGATEASIWSICHPIGTVDPSWVSIPYGRPLRDQFFLVLDPAGRPCPVGTPGELYIGGKGLARGYAGNPQETSARFRTHESIGARLYRTGDLGRWRPDGAIEFLGRVDRQIKVRGHRIEPGEIEAVLTRHPEVRQCVVGAVTAHDSGHRLVAYVVPQAPSAPPKAESLIEALREHVPGYMVPSMIVFLDALPVTVNGKIDHSALPDPYVRTNAPAPAPAAAPASVPAHRSEG